MDHAKLARQLLQMIKEVKKFRDVSFVRAQAEFIRQFKALEKDRIESWRGYKTQDNSYGICQRTLPLNFKNLEQRLFEEFNRLRSLEASVEKVLDRL